MPRPERTPHRSSADGREPEAAHRPSLRTTLRLETKSDVDGHIVLELHGEIDRASVELLRQAIESAQTSAAGTITVDLGRVGFIDLGGVRALVAAHQRLDGRLRLLEGPVAVQSLFRLTGTEDELPFA